MKKERKCIAKNGMNIMSINKERPIKIAILSMQRVVNFGSVLQAHSLRSILQEITGAEVSFLDIEENPALASKRSVRSSVDYASPAAYLPGIIQRGKRWIIARLSWVNKQLIRRFMIRELALSSKSNQSIYDCVVIGSDEVLNHRKGVNLQLHGDVRQTQHVISYATSCGCARVQDIAAEDQEKVRQCMCRFSALSVRDDATEYYASHLYDGPVLRHLDPVLVGNLYQRCHRKVWLKNYVLIYAYGQRIRTEEEIHAIQKFARERKLKTVAMGGSQFWCDMYIPATPFRLLDYFYYADYVITDTFHGAIFSVINQRKFVVISRDTNRPKLTSLLEDLSLSRRMIQNMKDLDCALMEEIDYQAVNNRLSVERKRTYAYLREQLENMVK